MVGFAPFASCGWSSSKLKNARSACFPLTWNWRRRKFCGSIAHASGLWFLFRDAKQSAGLSDCQARDKPALEFHWNASFACVNLAPIVAQPEKTANQPAVFSMKSLKQRFFNERLLKMFISKLGLEQTTIKYQEHYENLRNYAVIST